jgi:hypothetical protein
MLIFIVGTCSVLAQNAALPLTIIEKTGTKNAFVDISGTKYCVADINSKLEIHLNKTAINARIAAENNSKPVITDQLTAVNELIKKQTALLKLLDPQIAITNAGNIVEQRKTYGKLMNDFANDVKKVPGLEVRVNKLYENYYANLNVNRVKYSYVQNYVISNLPEIVKNITDELQQANSSANIKLQIVATIAGAGQTPRKVHVTNFDNYANGVYYEVPRWVTTFSQSDIDAFEQTGQLAGSLNQQINQNFSGIKKLLSDQLGSIDCFSTLLKELQQLDQDKNAIFLQSLDAASQYIDNNTQSVTTLINAIQALQALNGNDASGADALSAFNNISTQFINLAEKFPTSVDDLAAGLPVVIKNNPKIASFIFDLNKCLQQLKNDVELVKSLVQVVTAVISPAQGTSDAIGKTTGNQLSFTADQLPGLGIIDLKSTGKRDDGDILTIQLISLTQDDINNSRPGTVLNDYPIALEQIKFYSQSNISLIGAIPMGKSSSVKLAHAVQFAPSGSLILKFGSRTNPTWNAISPGIGFNLATPDFDLDGTPDISYGGVMTLFRNVLSVGISYNTRTSSPFWFFGLSLPFANLGLPFGQVKTN